MEMIMKNSMGVSQEWLSEYGGNHCVWNMGCWYEDWYVFESENFSWKICDHTIKRLRSQVKQ